MRYISTRIVSHNAIFRENRLNKVQATKRSGQATKAARLQNTARKTFGIVVNSTISKD